MTTCSRAIELVFYKYILLLLMLRSAVEQELVDSQYLVEKYWYLDIILAYCGAPARDLNPRCIFTVLGESVRRFHDDFVLTCWLTFKMHHVQSVLIHLLNHENNFSNAPDVIHIAYIYLRIDIKLAYLALL